MIKYKPQYIIMVLAIMLLTVSCGYRKNEEKVNNNESEQSVSRVFWGEHMTDDSKDLEDCLTKEYDLQELKDFFDGHNFHENRSMRPDVPSLNFEEVNKEFPVEIVRTFEYTVYKVRQGGYFYVFWYKGELVDEPGTYSEPIVWFSSYLTSEKSPTLFKNLKPGVSTAQDVKDIDPAFELLFSTRSRVSYSYLNENELLKIEYEDGAIRLLELGYDALIVKSISVIKRGSPVGMYNNMLSKDLP